MQKQFIVPDIDRIILMGVGGTGGYLAPGLAKIASGYQLQNEIVFVDFDVVEEKNIARQNFYAWEVGVNKAEAMAFRLNQQYGLAITAIDGRAEDFRLEHNDLVISCVDKIAPRKVFKNHGLWLDSGNERDYGQVILGTTCDPEELQGELEAWDNTPFLSHLPNPYLKLGLEHREDNKTPKPSCADHPFDEQGVLVNEVAAQAALAILSQVLIKGHVTTPAIYFKSEIGQMTPAKITQDYLEAA